LVFHSSNSNVALYSETAVGGAWNFDKTVECLWGVQRTASIYAHAQTKRFCGPQIRVTESSFVAVSCFEFLQNAWECVWLGG